MSDPTPQSSEQLGIPNISFYPPERFEGENGEADLLNIFIERTDALIDQIQSSPYSDRIDAERLRGYQEEIANGNIKNLKNWKERLRNNINDLGYIDALLSSPALAQADAAFLKSQTDLRQKADAEFDQHLTEHIQTLQKDTQKEIKEKVDRSVISKLTKERDRRLGGVPIKSERELLDAVYEMPNREFAAYFEETIMPDLNQKAADGDQAATVLLQTLKGHLPYKPSVFLGVYYRFNFVKSSCEITADFAKDGIPVINGKTITSSKDVDFRAFEKLTDQIYAKYEEIKQRIFPNDEARESKFQELKSAEEERRQKSHISDEEKLRLQEQYRQEAIKEFGDPSDTEPLKDETLQEKLEQLRQRLAFRKILRENPQLAIWMSAEWFDFNPKKVNFMNPQPPKEVFHTRGFGGNISTDEETGDIILDFNGLPNYFSRPPELISYQENVSVYRISERSVMGEETYLIRTRYKEGDKKAMMDFICLDMEGKEKNVTSVPFGKPMELKMMVRKPVIYVYSPEESNISVHLEYSGKVTSEYPKRYNGVWQGKSFPDGAIEIGGKKYPYLFWEGSPLPISTWDLSKGYCLKSDECEQFLENILDKFAFNQKEKTDFITYWLPELEKNPYSLVTFPIEAYSHHAQMLIEPQPKQIIRVFMVFKKLLQPIKIEAPAINQVNRTLNDLHVVEWGGVNITE